jgi:chlorobactene glucosyltransferase
MDLVLSISWLAFVLWLIRRAYAQRDVLPVAHPNQSLPPNAMPRLSIIVPARNESANLARCLSALLLQTLPADLFDIIVVDDHSTDLTFEIASAMARRWPQLKVIRSPPLPPQWVGKCHACWTGTRIVPKDRDWLCFLDADVVAEPNLLTSAMGAALGGRLDLLSLVPRQRLGSFAERLIIPCGFYLMAFCQDLGTVQAQQSDKVVASGQFMLIRRSVYEQVGGHAAVRNAICEDVALALLIKRAGGRVMLQDGKSLLSARMYSGWRTLWSGLSKNLVQTLGGPAATLAAVPCVIVLALASLLVPAVAAISCAEGRTASCIALAPAGVATAAAFGLHVAGSLYFDIPFWYGLLFPLGYAIGACLAVDSLRRRWRGRVVWKGRTYP